MVQKPGDLFLSILEFFGILIPGAIFTILHGATLLNMFGLSPEQLESIGVWVPAFFLSILVGHLLHGLSDPLDRIAIRYLSEKPRAYLKVASRSLKLPPGISDHPRSLFAPDRTKNLFYAAFSFIRINNAAAVAELERHAGDFKLFRSLTLLFFLEATFSIYPFYPVRLSLCLLMVIFAAFRFLQLFNWSYALAFELYTQIRGAEPARDGPLRTKKTSENQASTSAIKAKPREIPS